MSDSYRGCHCIPCYWLCVFYEMHALTPWPPLQSLLQVMCFLWGASSRRRNNFRHVRIVEESNGQLRPLLLPPRKESAPTGWTVVKYYTGDFYLNSSKMQLLLKLNKNIRRFIWRLESIYIILLNSSRNDKHFKEGL